MSSVAGRLSRRCWNTKTNSGMAKAWKLLRGSSLGEAWRSRGNRSPHMRFLYVEVEAALAEVRLSAHRHRPRQPLSALL
jgi:hypothetical protein